MKELTFDKFLVDATKVTKNVKYAASGRKALYNVYFKEGAAYVSDSHRVYRLKTGEFGTDTFNMTTDGDILDSVDYPEEEKLFRDLDGATNDIEIPITRELIRDVKDVLANYRETNKFENIERSKLKTILKREMVVVLKFKDNKLSIYPSMLSARQEQVGSSHDVLMRSGEFTVRFRGVYLLDMLTLAKKVGKTVRLRSNTALNTQEFTVVGDDALTMLVMPVRET